MKWLFVGEKSGLSERIPEEKPIVDPMLQLKTERNKNKTLIRLKPGEYTC